MRPLDGCARGGIGGGDRLGSGGIGGRNRRNGGGKLSSGGGVKSGRRLRAYHPRTGWIRSGGVGCVHRLGVCRGDAHVRGVEKTMTTVGVFTMPIIALVAEILSFFWILIMGENI